MRTRDELILEKIYIESMNNNTVYHGDDYGTSSITAKNMWLDGNSQEGIGIYFGPESVAKGYGKYLSTASVDPSKYVESRAIGSDVLVYDQYTELLTLLWKKDEESMYYYMTDFIEVYEIEDITEDHIADLANMTIENQVRHIQVELVQRFDINSVVEAWNKALPDVHGTYEPENHFYAIMNTGVEVTPVNF